MRPPTARDPWPPLVVAFAVLLLALGYLVAVS